MMRSNPPTDFDLQEKVRRELEIDETIQWIDMPVPRFFTPFSIGAFLFAIPWTGFAVFWTFGAAGFTIPDFSEGLSGVDIFPLFGLPFILIGIGLLTTPIRTYWRALKTVYVITDQRAITIQGGRTTVVRSFPPRDLQNIFRKEKRDGTGDVIITSRCSAGFIEEQRLRAVGLSPDSESKRRGTDAEEIGRGSRRAERLVGLHHAIQMRPFIACLRYCLHAGIALNLFCVFYLPSPQPVIAETKIETYPLSLGPTFEVAATSWYKECFESATELDFPCLMSFRYEIYDPFTPL
jgi:hypothetical protein